MFSPPLRLDQNTGHIVNILANERSSYTLFPWTKCEVKAKLGMIQVYFVMQGFVGTVDDIIRKHSAEMPTRKWPSSLST